MDWKEQGRHRTAAACEKTGGSRWNLGFPRHRIPSLGGWLIYFAIFLYIQSRIFGESMIQFDLRIKLSTWVGKSQQLAMFSTSWQYFPWCFHLLMSSGYPTPREHCRWDVQGIPGVGLNWYFNYHQIPGKPKKCSMFFVGNGKAGFRGFQLMEINSNGCFPGINFVDFGRNMLQFPVAQEFYRLLFEKEPDLKKLCLGFVSRVYLKKSTLKVNAFLLWNLKDAQ